MVFTCPSYCSTDLESRRLEASWKVHAQAGRMAYDHGFYAAAVRNFQQALAAAQQLDVPECLQGSILVGLARCYAELGNSPEAERLFTYVLQIDESDCTDPSCNLAMDLNDLAHLYIKIGKLDLAESCLQRALMASERISRQKVSIHEQVLKNMGLVACAQGRLEQAQKFLTKAMHACEASNNKEDMASVLAALAKLAMTRGSLEEAEQMIQQSISMFQLLTGGQHPEVAELLDLAAEIMKRKGAIEQALTIQQSAKTIRDHLKAVDH